MGFYKKHNLLFFETTGRKLQIIVNVNNFEKNGLAVNDRRLNNTLGHCIYDNLSTFATVLFHTVNMYRLWITKLANGINIADHLVVVSTMTWKLLKNRENGVIKLWLVLNHNLMILKYYYWIIQLCCKLSAKKSERNFLFC